MNNIRKDFHDWCKQNDMDTEYYYKASIAVYNCRVTNKAWKLWQDAYEAGYEAGCSDSLEGGV